MKYLRETTSERVGLNEHTPHQVTAYSDSGKLLVDNGYYRGSSAQIEGSSVGKQRLDTPYLKTHITQRFAYLR